MLVLVSDSDSNIRVKRKMKVFKVEDEKGDERLRNENQSTV